MIGQMGTSVALAQLEIGSNLSYILEHVYTLSVRNCRVLQTVVTVTTSNTTKQQLPDISIEHKHNVHCLSQLKQCTKIVQTFSILLKNTLGTFLTLTIQNLYIIYLSNILYNNITYLVSSQPIKNDSLKGIQKQFIYSR